MLVGKLEIVTITAKRQDLIDAAGRIYCGSVSVDEIAAVVEKIISALYNAPPQNFKLRTSKRFQIFTPDKCTRKLASDFLVFRYVFLSWTSLE